MKQPALLAACNTHLQSLSVSELWSLLAPQRAAAALARTRAKRAAAAGLLHAAGVLVEHCDGGRRQSGWGKDACHHLTPSAREIHRPPDGHQAVAKLEPPAAPTSYASPICFLSASQAACSSRSRSCSVCSSASALAARSPASSCSGHAWGPHCPLSGMCALVCAAEHAGQQGRAAAP